MSKFLKTIFWIILIAALLIVAALFIPPQLGITTEVVDSAERSTNLPYASVSYMEAEDATQLKTGDVVLLTGENAQTAYKITGVADAASGMYTVLSISDRTGATESMTLTGTVEKIIVTIPYIGYAAIATQSTEGYIILGLLLVFEIVLFILSELWKKATSDDEEADETEEEEEDGSAGKDGAYADAGDDTTRIAGEPGSSRETAGGEASSAPTISFSQTDISKEIAASIAAIQEDEARDGARTVLDATENAGQPDERMEISVETEVSETEETSPGPETEESRKDTPAAADTDQGAASGSGDFSADGYTPEELNAEAAGPNGFVPVRRPTFDELMEQAKKKGEKPKVKKDDDTGVTLVDYSDLI